MTHTLSNKELAKNFRQLFEISPALDAASIEAVYRIRHEVYCRDLGWEPVREDGLEIDAYDEHSVHCLLRKRDTGESVGCTRVILPHPDNPYRPLPFELSCAKVLDRTIVDPATMERSSIAEVSRLAVLNFRQRKGENITALSVSDGDFSRRDGVARFPFIPVSLYLSAIAIGQYLDIENLFVLTEPRLAKHFERIGFDIRPVGGSIEHRGTRIPSLLSSSNIVRGLRPTIKPLYEMIEESVREAFRAHNFELGNLSAPAP